MKKTEFFIWVFFKTRIFSIKNDFTLFFFEKQKIIYTKVLIFLQLFQKKIFIEFGINSTKTTIFFIKKLDPKKTL